ncbi:MAG: NusG domain II-containing protein [Lachnospiraceae bacterium]|nr:NusG domain II-containing protein [Lachnospiraceae bacterium]
MKKNDVILIAGLLLAALAAFGGISWYLSAGTQKAEAVVEVDGQEEGRYPLDQDTSVEIQLEDGSYNRLEIKDGRADITEASCPDKICVDHRPVSRRGESLVCLPNKVVVEIVNGQEAEVDGMTH